MSSPDVLVRVARRDDVEPYSALYDAVAAEGRWIGHEAPMDRGAQSQRFEARLHDEDAETFVAEADGRLVGTLGVELRHGIATLGMLVDHGWRRRGVGSLLMETCITWATQHEAHKVTLEVFPHNAPALSLYGKYGFEREGYLRRHYRRRNGELWDVIVMGRVLDLAAPGSPCGAGAPQTN